jgi:hypothetical protein
MGMVSPVLRSRRAALTAPPPRRRSGQRPLPRPGYQQLDVLRHRRRGVSPVPAEPSTQLAGPPRLPFLECFGALQYLLHGLFAAGQSARWSLRIPHRALKHRPPRTLGPLSGSLPAARPETTSPCSWACCPTLPTALYASIVPLCSEYPGAEVGTADCGATRSKRDRTRGKASNAAMRLDISCG